MYLVLRKQKSSKINKVFSAFLLVCFVGNAILPGYSFAETAFNLPAVGSRVSVSEPFTPAIIKGLQLFADNPLKFNFIIDTGDSKLSGEELKAESTKLIRYFLSALTVPDEDLWVNLSPIEKERIIADDLVKTEMGRDMLSQDYLLKQITASLVYPEGDLGKKFWAKVRKQAQEKFGTSDVPMDTLNKVWIVPEHALIYENNGAAFVIENQLKVMLEEDYIVFNTMKTAPQTLGKDVSNSNIFSVIASRNSNKDGKDASTIGSQIVREIIIPELEKEVNTGKNFANLRQITNAVVLASWYKRNLKESLLGKVYINQNKVKGIDLAEKDAKLKIYDQYLQSLKAGVYNYIKEDYDPVAKEMLPTKYFSGGIQYGAQNTEIVQGPIDSLEPGMRERVGTGSASIGTVVGVDTALGENPTSSSSGELAESKGVAIPAGSRETDLATTGVAISFGTSGWRGKNGGDFVLENILRAAQGTASYVIESGKKKVIVGFDTREGNPTFSKETAALLAANGIQVIYVNAAATPTPALALLAQQLAESDKDFGGVINFTASHSPAQDNGFKFSPAHGGAADKAVTDRITVLANGATKYRTMDYEEAKFGGLIQEIDSRQVVETYKNYAVGILKSTADKNGVSAWDSIINYFKQNPSKRVILDPMQGTSVLYLQAIYGEIAQAVGRADMITLINTNNADSKFLDVNGRPQPDAKDSHKNLLAEVNKNQGNALGISTDGDADRFGFIDFNGKFVSADDLIGLLAYFLKGDAGLEGAIGKTVVTSDFSNRVAEYLKTEIDELPVGFKWFVEQAAKNGRNYAVAGEESAHVMVGPFAKTWDDGIAVGLTVLWMVARSGQSLGDYKENVEKLLDVRYLTSVKTIRDDVRGEEMKKELGVKIQAVRDAMGGRSFSELSAQEKAAVPFVALIEADTGMKVEDIVLKDGVKFVMSGGSVAMRPSGTEPAVKVYVQAKQVLSKDAQGTEATQNRDLLEAVGKKIIDAQSIPAVPAAEATVAEESGDTAPFNAVTAVDEVMSTQVPKIVTDMNAGYGVSDAAQFDGANKFKALGFDGKFNRLGWGVQGLSQINQNPQMLQQTFDDAEAILQGYRFVIFSGMGGSGLSEQLVQTTYGEGRNGVRMYSLRTTDPAVIAAILNDIIESEAKAGRTITMADLLSQLKVVVSSKSGTTAETNSHKDHFEKLYTQHNVDKAGHFMLVTDPSSPMEAEAKEKGYDLRYIQLNKGTDIGGRFTAPTTNIFLLPLAMVLERERVLEILRIAEEMNSKKDINQDQFLQLASFLYVMQNNGKDKVTFMLPEALRDLGLWAEQLVEESLGKEGKGIKIYYGERLSSAELTSPIESDRVFVRFNLGGVQTNQEFSNFLKDQGYPVFDIVLNNINELGGVTLGLQRTVATIANLMDINFVTQPGVEDYKRETKAVLAGTPKGEIVQTPADWKFAGYKGQVNVYYSTFLASGIATEDQLKAEVARLGADMSNGAAVYAAMINLAAANQTASTFKAAEIASYGRMTAGFRQALEDFRFNAFTQGFKMPAKIGEAPDKLHSYQQMVQQGPNDALSMYFMPEVSEQPPGGVTYDINNLRAPAIGSTLALMKAGRKVIFTTFNSSIEDSEGIAKEFFAEVQSLLKTNIGGINLDPKLFNLQIKRNGNGVALPVYEQSIGDMKIDGFVPIIINITPLDIAPLLSSVAGDDAQERQKLSLNIAR